MKKRYTFLLQGLLAGIAASSCWAMEPLDDQRPAEHFCPITLQVMKDPVVASDGHSYERKAIQEHLQKTPEPTSPITGLPVNKQNLLPNQTLKVMIQDWKPGLQRGPSVLKNRSAEAISQQIRNEFNKNAALLNAAKDQHIVAFLGNTGAGKSTLVNLLSGKQLKVSTDGEDYILVDPSDSKAMPIGIGGGSETLYPKCIDIDGLRLFDLPGFNDTDGSERNLVNAAFIRKILLDAASVRLVFVAGQDQFTADRSSSIRQMFNCLKQLFVVEQDVDLVDQGIFIATKVTCAPQTELTEFLLKKTNSNDKETLNEQLQSWNKSGRISRMFHPLRDSNNENVKEQILDLIKGTTGTKIQGINISALYPSDTQQDLERMFLDVLEKEFARKLESQPRTLFDYESEINYYQSEDLWQRFERELCREDGAIAVLKDFCAIPYNKALRSFERNSTETLKEYIKDLQFGRQKREKKIEEKTEQKAKEVISRLVPVKEGDTFVTFDFAYHKDFYDEVCGANAINQLTNDSLEQEIVRRHYAGFISQHSHNQMKYWFEKFSGVEELARNNVTLTKKVETLQEGMLELQREKQAREEKRIRKAEIERQAKEAAERKAAEEQRLAQAQLRITQLVGAGNEQIYQRFLNGKLVYKPNEDNDIGKIEFNIANLANPLEGTFDLSQCGDTAKYVSISTGYKKEKRPENAGKVEIWFTPRFLVEKEINGSAQHFKPIFPEDWPHTAHVGIFWTWGGSEDNGGYYGITHATTEVISELNLTGCWANVNIYYKPMCDQVINCAVGGGFEGCSKLYFKLK